MERAVYEAYCVCFYMLYGKRARAYYPYIHITPRSNRYSGNNTNKFIIKFIVFFIFLFSPTSLRENRE